MNSVGFPDYAIQGPLATIPFNVGTPDINGCYWYLDGGIAGWDSPDGRVTMLPKIGSDPDADGEYPADQHYRGRSLTFTLIAACPTEILRQEAWYLLAEATDLVNVTGLFIANEEVPKQCVVSRSGNNSQGKLVMIEQGMSSIGQISNGLTLPYPGDATQALYILRAEIELYSVDPRKYVQTPVVVALSGGAATLTNLGNTMTQNIELEITSGIVGLSGPISIVLAGKTMQLVVPTLPAGAPSPGLFPSELFIDFYNKLITDASGNNYYYLRNLQTPWPTLPKGVSTLTVSGATVAGNVTYSSAWI
jgi:hypothetical protein